MGNQISGSHRREQSSQNEPEEIGKRQKLGNTQQIQLKYENS
jgi:hypothetical protein